MLSCETPKDTPCLGEGGRPFAAPLVLGLALLWLWLLWLLLVWTSLDHLPPDPPSTGPPSAGPPKISFFFFTIPPPFRCFCVSLVFSLNFGGVFEGRNPEMCTFGLSGCRVKPRRPHQTGPLEGSGTSNSTRRPPERDRNNETVAGKGRKKREILGPPPFGAPPSGPHPSGPTLSGPTLSGPHPFGAPPFRGPTLSGPHPSGPHPSGPHPSGPHPSGAPMGKTLKLAKVGLAKVGLAKVGQH